MASFKKLKTGWQYRISYKENGVYKTKNGNGFPNKRAAQVAANAIESKLFKGAQLNGGEILLSDYFETWINTYKIGKYTLGTDQVYKGTLKLIKDHLPGIKLKELTKKEYQTFIDKYAEGHSKESTRKRSSHIRACLADAIDEKIIFSDPTRKVVISGKKPPKNKDDKFLSYEDYKKLIEELKSNLNPLYVGRYMILLGASTGARFSEICGLTWSDIDFKNRTIDINKNWDYKDKLDFKTTKTESSNRKISIDNDIIEILKGYQKDQIEILDKFGLENDKNLVFLNYEGNIITNSSCNKTLIKLCDRLEINPITFHGLRHTHASILLYKGINLITISKRLGHAELTTTSNIYSHIVKEMEESDSLKINSIMEGLFNSDDNAK